MKYKIAATVLTAVLFSLPLAPSVASAQSATGQSSGQMGTGEGEVRRIDAANSKITVRHGPLAGMKTDDGKDMPGMTMVFVVKDPSALSSLKVGDKVQFTVAREGGAMVIQSIEPIR